MMLLVRPLQFEEVSIRADIFRIFSVFLTSTNFLTFPFLRVSLTFCLVTVAFRSTCWAWNPKRWCCGAQNVPEGSCLLESDLLWVIRVIVFLVGVEFDLHNQWLLPFVFPRFDGRVVAKLPFVPLSYIQGLSHRNLLGEDYTDCSFIFLYILCTMSIRQVSPVSPIGNWKDALFSLCRNSDIKTGSVYLSRSFFFSPSVISSDQLKLSKCYSCLLVLIVASSSVTWRWNTIQMKGNI